MRIDEIKQKINEAMESVKGIPEPFKLKAFEVILSHSLEYGLSSAKETNLNVIQKGKSEESKEFSVQNLCKVTGLTTDQLNDIFQFGAECPEFIGKVNGNEKEKQVFLSRLLILISKYVYAQDWVKGSFLWKALKDYGVRSLDNLAHNLETDGDNFNTKGKGKGKEYKLTKPGENAAIESLKNLVKK